MTPEVGISEDGNVYVNHPEIPEFAMPTGPMVVQPMMAVPTSITTASDAVGLLNAISGASTNPMNPTTIQLANDITVTTPIIIDGGRNIVLDTAGHTLGITVSNSSAGPNGSYALMVNWAQLRVEGGGAVNITVTNAHIGLDVWSNAVVYVVAGTEMNITNSGSSQGGTVLGQSGGQVRGIRALMGSTVTVRGNIIAHSNNPGGVGLGAAGIRSRNSTVTVHGNITASGAYSTGIFVSNEQSTVSVSGTVTATGNNSQQTLVIQDSGMGTAGADTITIGGASVTPQPPTTTQPPVDPPTTTPGGDNEGSGGSGGDSGNDSNNDSTQAPSTSTQTTTNPIRIDVALNLNTEEPAVATVLIPSTVNPRGVLAFTVSDVAISQVLRDVRTAARNNRTTVDELVVRVEIEVAEDDNITGMNGLINRSVINSLANANATLHIATDVFSAQLDQEALQQLLEDVSGNVRINIARPTNLRTAARNIIGTRPVYSFTMRDTRGNGLITSLETGQLTLGIAYHPTSEEASSNLFIANVAGIQPTEVDSSFENGWFTWIGTPGGVYGVGYR